MNIELNAGDIVKIENAYFKNDNGLYFVEHCPGDAGWSGKYYSLTKICKNGKISKTKYKTSSWPLFCHTNDVFKKAECNAWNKEHAIIERIDGINTDFIIEHFKNHVDESTEQYRYYLRTYGEKSVCTSLVKECIEHYTAIVKRMTA